MNKPVYEYLVSYMFTRPEPYIGHNTQPLITPARDWGKGHMTITRDKPLTTNDLDALKKVIADDKKLHTDNIVFDNITNVQTWGQPVRYEDDGKDQ